MDKLATARQQQTDLPHERVITMMNFKIMAAVHGNHDIPEGKGKVYPMTAGGFIQLDSQWDSWIPLENENFYDQVLRVSFTPEFLDRRERSRQKQIELYMQSPSWRKRWEKNPRYFDEWDPPGVCWIEEK